MPETGAQGREEQGRAVPDWAAQGWVELATAAPGSAAPGWVGLDWVAPGLAVLDWVDLAKEVEEREVRATEVQVMVALGWEEPVKADPG